jgi:hypothetical protein
MAAWILGTTCVHNISPACAVMIIPCGGKSKNARPDEGGRFSFRFEFYGQVPGLGGGGTNSGSGPLSRIYSTGGGAIAGGQEPRLLLQGRPKIADRTFERGTDKMNGNWAIKRVGSRGHREKLRAGYQLDQVN